MICVVVPVISVEGGAAPRCTRCTAFWIDIASTSVMPVANSPQLSPGANGPSARASAAATHSSSVLAVSSRMNAGLPASRRACP